MRKACPRTDVSAYDLWDGAERGEAIRPPMHSCNESRRCLERASKVASRKNDLKRFTVTVHVAAAHNTSSLLTSARVQHLDKLRVWCRYLRYCTRIGTRNFTG